MAGVKFEETSAYARFPLSRKYDLDWMQELAMGPNPLWLAEYLTEAMPLESGMKVLDLGCGKAATSVFLAREFGVEVWAADLWIDAESNVKRMSEAGFSDQVHPVHCEAHSMPFEHDFFDAIVSFDAYHYFGTSNTYIGYVANFLKRGGSLGFVVPGLKHEFDDEPPEHLRRFWYWDFWTFHSPDWWRRHLDRSGKVDVTTADTLPDGWKYWLEWNRLYADLTHAPDQESEMLAIDAGRNLGFTRCIAKRVESPEKERWLTFSPG